MMQRGFRSTVLVFLLCGFTYAQEGFNDEVRLKSGASVVGKIIEDIPGDHIKVQSRGGSVFDFKYSEIDRINRQTLRLPTTSPDSKNTLTQRPVVVQRTTSGETKQSEVTDYPAQTGFYIGGAISYSAIGGSFDGDHYIANGYDPFLIFEPKIDGGFGWRIILGGRHNQGEFEVFNQTTTHDWDYGGIKGEASDVLWGLDVKVRLRNEHEIQPYIGFAGAFELLKLKKAAAEEVWNMGERTYVLRDARFEGYGLSLTAGLALHLSPVAWLDIGTGYRWNEYGKHGIVELDNMNPNVFSDEAIIGGGLYISAGVNVILIPFD